MTQNLSLSLILPYSSTILGSLSSFLIKKSPQIYKKTSTHLCQIENGANERAIH